MVLASLHWSERNMLPPHFVLTIGRQNRLAALLLLCGSSLSIGPSIAFAQSQDPFRIRVEVNAVVLPVIVIDKSHISGGYEYDKAIKGITAKKFHVFEDGIEQKIQSVSFGFDSLNSENGVTDNVGFHLEVATSGSGIWTSPDSRPVIRDEDSPDRMYTVSYTPPPSSKGSCHQIKVQVDNRHATLDYRDEYCNVEFPGSDPLNGTKLGKQLEHFVSTTQGKDLALNARVSSLFGQTNSRRVQMVLELPSEAVKRNWSNNSLQATMALMGTIYDVKKDVVARFSDSWSTHLGAYRGKIPASPELRKLVESTWIPNGYETQIELSPGDYDLKLVLTDGENFGQMEMPLKVGGYDANNLAISDIILCKRYHQPVARPSGYVPLISKNLEYSPTGNAHFSKYEPVLAYFQVRDPLLEKSGNANVQFELRVIDEKTGEIKIGTGLRPADSWIQPGNAIVSIAEGVVVDKLALGNYRMEIQASDSTGSKTEWRVTSFTVQ